MHCAYCFAKYDLTETKRLTHMESLDLIDRIASAGTMKLTFAGGEPTLCPWLPDLISHAKNRGLTTMLVTNGTGLTDSFLTKMRGLLDWIGISVNSLHVNLLKSIGAQCRNMIIDSDFYYRIVDEIKAYGYRLKVNTVVCSVNCNEDFTDFITYANPERWKIFQMLPLMPGSQRFKVDLKEFRVFYERHANKVTSCIDIIAEDNHIMTESYVMIDPIGRFYDNGKGRHSYSASILDVGIEEAFRQIIVDDSKMLERNAVYNW